MWCLGSNPSLSAADRPCQPDQDGCPSGLWALFRKQMVGYRRRESSNLSSSATSNFLLALAQLDQSTGLRSQGLHVRIVCARPFTFTGLRAAMVLQETVNLPSSGTRQVRSLGNPPTSPCEPGRSVRRRPSKASRRVRFPRLAPPHTHHNEVAKRLKAPVCKSGEHCSSWVRIPSSFPNRDSAKKIIPIF